MRSSTIAVALTLALACGCSVAPECASALCGPTSGASAGGTGEAADAGVTAGDSGSDTSAADDAAGSDGASSEGGSSEGGSSGDDATDGDMTAGETGCSDGSGEACAAVDCMALLDGGTSESGVYWIAPDGVPFEVYCDMDSDGGGWALVWKQHGGAQGGESSTATLLGAGGQPGAITPPEAVLATEKSAAAFDHYFTAPGRQWLKRSVLWDPDGAVVRTLTLRLDFSVDALSDVFAADGFCTQLAGPVAVHIDGQPLGQTDWVIRNDDAGVPVNYGLAHDGVDGSPETQCGESPGASDNLIATADDTPDGGLLGQARLNGRGSITINNVFSYRHHESGQDASRCTFTCWGSSGNDIPDDGYYDATVWAAR